MGQQVADDWAIQVTIRHGAKDDKGVPVNMTNIRGYTARDIADQASGLGEYSDQIQAGIAMFLAKDAIKQAFPEAKQLEAPARSSGNSFKDRDGEICEPHKLPMRYKEVRSSKTGKLHELLECSAAKSQNPCDTIWNN